MSTPPGVVGQGATQMSFAPLPGALQADLSAASGVLLNQLRQSITIQELLELDARGGTRYIELVRAHFGVISPDARLQRPEYLGGGSVPININPIAQTGQTGLTGGSTPLGTLGGIATAVDSGNGFTQSFTEHGIIIGIASIVTGKQIGRAHV